MRTVVQKGNLEEVFFFLGEGLRLFEHLGNEQIELERMRVLESPTRTDLRFRVVK